jgi:hypothetical protein
MVFACCLATHAMFFIEQRRVTWPDSSKKFDSFGETHLIGMVITLVIFLKVTVILKPTNIIEDILLSDLYLEKQTQKCTQAIKKYGPETN